MSSNSAAYPASTGGGRHGGGGGGGGGGRSQTVHLHRFVSLNDRFDTHIFTFVVPAALHLGHAHEVFTKDFAYANQHWNLRLVRSDRHVGAFLSLRNALSGMLVRLDYSFVVINREHFTRNETVSEREADFTGELPARGRSALIEVSDLSARNFLFDDHVFLLELQLKNPLTLFRDDLVLPREVGRELAPRRVESSYFNFGACDWNLSIEQSEGGGSALLLSRHSRFEHWCRIIYRVVFSSVGDQKQRAIDSGVVEHLMDADGYGRSYPVQDNVFRLANSKGQLRMEIKMLAMNPMAIVELVPTSRTKNLARFYDCEKREWLLESDILGKVVKFRLFYADIHNLPPHFARLVAFKAYIVPYDRNQALVRAMSSPYCCFYAQKEIDDGFEVSMNLAVEQVCDAAAGYVHPQQGSLTIQIEWVYNHLLCYDQYHYYDNISRLHKHQMSREILALQAENYALEKQVHNYQINLSTRGLDEQSTRPGTPSSVHGAYPASVGTPQRSYPSTERPPARGYANTAGYMDPAVGQGYGQQPSVAIPQDRLRRALPNAPSPQHRRTSQHQDFNGPAPGSGYRSSYSSNHPSAYNSAGRAGSPMARKVSSPSLSQRGHSRQRNGREAYDDGYGRSGRRMEERW